MGRFGEPLSVELKQSAIADTGEYEAYTVIWKSGDMVPLCQTISIHDDEAWEADGAASDGNIHQRMVDCTNALEGFDPQKVRKFMEDMSSRRCRWDSKTWTSDDPPKSPCECWECRARDCREEAKE